MTTSVPFEWQELFLAALFWAATLKLLLFLHFALFVCVTGELLSVTYQTLSESWWRSEDWHFVYSAMWTCITFAWIVCLDHSMFIAGATAALFFETGICCLGMYRLFDTSAHHHTIEPWELNISKHCAAHGLKMFFRVYLPKSLFTGCLSFKFAQLESIKVVSCALCTLLQGSHTKWESMRHV